MHRVRRGRLGVPQDSRDAFDLLARSGALEPELAEAMQRMVGFRNVAVHAYARADLAIVRSIIERHLGELERFAQDSILAARPR